MTEQIEGLRLSVSVSRKANLGNYQSADFFMSVSNIEVGATEAELQEALATGEVAFAVIKDAIDEKIAAILNQKAEIQQRATPPARPPVAASRPAGEERPTPTGYRARR